MRSARRRCRLSPWPGTRASTLLVVGVSGVSWNFTPRLAHRLHRAVDVVRAQRDVLDALAAVVARNSSICEWSSRLSFSGMRILPSGLVMALENRPVCWPSMSK
jgi:hypothetical protein